MLAEGMPAADFSLIAHTGETVRLYNLFSHRPREGHGSASGGPVLLIFFRGHFCPFCRRYLSKIQANLRRFRERGVRVFAISPERRDIAERLARELNLQFPLLCDTSGEVIDLYGTRNRFGGGRVLLTHPAVFVLDAEGIVRFKSIDRNYKLRTRMRTIFASLPANAIAAA